MVVTKYNVISELHWPPNFDTVIVRVGKRRPKNPPSVWLGITLSQIPTANPTERTTQRSLSGIRSTLDDELDTFLKRDKATFCDIKNKFINSSDHQYPVISFMVDGYIVIQSLQFFNGIPFFAIKIYENLTFETFHYGIKCQIASLTVHRIIAVDNWSKFNEILRFLSSLKMENKKEVIMQHILVMGPKTVGNKLYTPEILIRSLYIFQHQGHYIIA